MIVVLSGPSGAGKSRLTDIAVTHHGFCRVVPRTTREPRETDRDGVDYVFMARADFQEGIRGGRFFDWDYLLGNYYGYEHDLADAARAGALVIIPVVARMALRLRQRLPAVVLVYLDGPDEVLDARVEQRVISNAELAVRRAHRAEEREHAPLFDRVLLEAATSDQATLERLLRELQQGRTPTEPATE